MWEERDPRAPRSIAGARLRTVHAAESRLSHWPPPHRDTEAKPRIGEPDELPEIAAKQAPRGRWHLKAPPT